MKGSAVSTKVIHVDFIKPIRLAGSEKITL
jgi:hypothetical protein